MLFPVKNARLVVASLTLGASVLFVTPWVSAQEAHHDHASHEAHDHAAHANAELPTPPNGERWATDEPLRAGMSEVRQAVNLLEHYAMGHLDKTQAINGAEQIEDAVSSMIANCKLAPDADAALHVLLARFLEGAKAIRDDADVNATMATLREAVKRYPELFDHPGWDSPAS